MVDGQKNPAAGWCADPGGSTSLRYWDGGGWTSQVREGDDSGAPTAHSRRLRLISGAAALLVAAVVAGGWFVLGGDEGGQPEAFPATDVELTGDTTTDPPSVGPDVRLIGTITVRTGTTATALLPPVEAENATTTVEGSGIVVDVTPTEAHLVVSVSTDADVQEGTATVMVDFCQTAAGACGAVELTLTVEIVSAEVTGSSRSILRPSPQRVDAASPEAPALVVDELVVYAAPGFDGREVRHAIAAVGGMVVGQLPSVGIFQARFPDQDRIDQIAVQLADSAAIRTTTRHLLEPRGIAATQPNGTPNDWDDDGEAETWHHRLTGAVDAWALGYDARSVGVGIVDEAVFAKHEDLVNVVATKFPDNPISPGSLGVGDNYAHGTHVAALACGEGGNKLGLVGTAWGCQLHTFDKWAEHRDIDAPDVGSTVYLPTRTSVLYTYLGILDVIDRGASVVNISLATSAPDDHGVSCSEFLTDSARQDARAAAAIQLVGYEVVFASHPDVLFVLAAGNNCTTIDLVAPAGAALSPALTNVITVGSVDADRRVSAFSSFGEGVSLLAPGGFYDRNGAAVWSAGAFPCSTFGGCDSRYQTLAGTSQAAPQVAGAAALLLQQRPEMTPPDLIDCLLSSPNRPPGVSDYLPETRAARAADPTWATTTPILHIPTAIECAVDPGPGMITVQGVSYAEPLAGDWTRNDSSSGLVAMYMGNSSFDIFALPGSRIEATLADMAVLWEDLVEEGMYERVPEWFTEVDIVGADRAVRYSPPSYTGDGISEVLLIEAGGVTIEASIYLYLYFEDLDRLSYEDLAYFLDSIRIDPNRLPEFSLEGPTAAGFANCRDGSVVAFGGSTETGFDIAVCVDSGGRLEYHGVEVATGLGIRLPACQLVEGIFVAVNLEILYVVDARVAEALSSDLSIYGSTGVRFLSDLFSGVVGTGAQGRSCSGEVLAHPAISG